jgi:metal transporter CNNM
MIYFVVFVLVLLSAIFSGLTLGLFSLSKDDLRRKVDLGNPHAAKVYKIREDGNLLLCTLLIGNVAVNSTLSIFLGTVAGSILAGLLATSLIVVFGEILPQAFFSRYALVFGAKFYPVVLFFEFILYPICKPIAMFLDKMLGAELPTIYSKKELVKIIEEHEDMPESRIDKDEEKIMKGALSYSDKTVANIMTPRTELVTLRYSRKLNKKNVSDISMTGHSRIPVYKKNEDDIIGILYVKDLIHTDVTDKTVGDMARDSVIFVDPDRSLDDLLNDFKRTRNHLFIVLNKFGSVEGLVTIEDVIEEIIGDEIVDEFDLYDDLQKRAKHKAKKKTVITATSQQ